VNIEKYLLVSVTDYEVTVQDEYLSAIALSDCGPVLSTLNKSGISYAELG